MFSSPPTENDARAEQSVTKKKQRRPRLHFPSIVASVCPPPTSEGLSSSRLDPPLRGERTTNRDRLVAIKNTRLSPAPQISSVCSNGEESCEPRIRQPVEIFSAGEVGEGKAATMPLSLVFVILTAATGTGACRKFINRSRYSFEIVLFQPCHHPPCSNDVTNTHL